MQRRKFIGLSTTALTAIALTQCGELTSQRVRYRRVPNLEAGATAPSTPIYRSTEGQLTVQFVAQPATLPLGDSAAPGQAQRLAQLLTYNGQIPGPRLEAQPGDTVTIHFTNQLDQPTNLHYHGLHIPPTGTGDNVFLSIPPGEQYTYEFQIPDNHPAGTFWYHPHVHGRVAEQLFGGLAGLFIVRGELDEIPEIQAAQEQFLVIKDFALDAAGQIPPPGHVAQMTGRIGDILTANGQVNPALAIAQGDLLRLRLLNAAPSRFLRLSLESHQFHLIATDGGAVAQPIALDILELAPGERAEVLVQGNQQPGQYRLFNHPFNPAQDRGMGMMRHHQPPNRSDTTTTETLATLTYKGQRDALSLPQELIPIRPLPKPTTTREFMLNHGMAMGQGMVFLINGQAFDPQQVNTSVQLETTEDWLITNTGNMAHPFHVHTNKFQVISRNGTTAPYAAWKDVVMVRPGEQVRLRMQFKDYTGKTVYHCHVLDHEDRGMMGILEIQSA